ncbi:uncharacterized protein At4g18490 [Mercurialis annua]|uniref:uncharacterized protein At4g18490 n=1 Tax=Mercurialis annua TaxID=3986 RepID=UPI0024AD1BF7|nr:uncharacterized protein At4g18490 [Mercurialis annua]
MAESQRGTSASSVDPKKKKSSLDDEFGTEFLSSWKTGDDMMDFNFDSVSSGKKKAFNFGKLDMDFNLDGDFDKLTSFKVDMPDLDFSSPPKNAAQPKENLKGDSSDGNRQGKQDSFNFSFDFNELDDFNFGSTLGKGEKRSVKNLDNKRVGSDSTEHKGSKVNPPGTDDGKLQGSKVSLVDGKLQASKVSLVVADTDQTENLLTSDDIITSVAEIAINGAGTRISSKDSFPSVSGNVGVQVVSHGENSLPDKSIFLSAEETDHQCNSLEMTMPTVPRPQQALQNLPVQAVDANELSQDSESDILADSQISKATLEPTIEIDASDRIIAGESHDEKSQLKDLAASCTNRSESFGGENEKINSEIPAENIDTDSDIQAGSQVSKATLAPRPDVDASDRIIAGESHDEKSQLKDLAALCTNRSESNGGENEKINSETSAKNIARTEPVSDDSDLEATSAASILPEGPHKFKVDKDIQKSTSKLLVPLRSEYVAPTGNKVMPTKEKHSELARSKYFKSSKESELQLCQPSSAGLKISFSGSKGISSLSPLNEKRESFNDKSVQIQRKLTEQLTKEEPALPGSQKKVTTLCSAYGAPAVDKVMPIKEKHPELVRSNSLKSCKESEPQVCQPSLAGLKISSSGSKGLSSLSPSNEKREGFNVKSVQTQRKLTEKLTKEESALPGSEKKVKTLCHVSGKVNSASTTYNATKSNTKTNINPTAVVSSMGSSWNSRMTSVEALKARKSIPDISSLKISRTTGVSKDQSDAALKNETSSLRNTEKTVELQGVAAFKMVHNTVNAERKTLLIPSLKRKTLEVSNDDMVQLNPQKRVSQSPSGNLKRPLENTVEEEPKSVITSVLHNHPTIGLELPQHISTKEQDVYFDVEYNENVKKAEAYAKELDDLCSMLKKKNEEAKELLVRAVVNNNRLLMLNHPMFDEKISFHALLQILSVFFISLILT